MTEQTEMIPERLPEVVETDDWREALTFLILRTRIEFQKGNEEDPTLPQTVEIFTRAHERGWEYDGMQTTAFFMRHEGLTSEDVAAAVYGMAESGQLTEEDFEEIFASALSSEGSTGA